MIKFGFEDLEFWQKAVEFSNRVINLVENIGLMSFELRAMG